MDKPVEVRVENETIRQALDSILQNGRGYSWRSRNGIIEITNTRASKRAQSQLDTVIPVFTIPDGENARTASVMLWWNLQQKLDPKIKGFGGDILGGVSPPTVTPTTLRNRTVREILALSE